MTRLVDLAILLVIQAVIVALLWPSTSAWIALPGGIVGGALLWGLGMRAAMAWHDRRR